MEDQPEIIREFGRDFGLFISAEAGIGGEIGAWWASLVGEVWVWMSRSLTLAGTVWVS